LILKWYSHQNRRWADTLNPDRKHAVKYYDILLKEGKKASTIANILFALKHYYDFIGKELNLKPPKQTVKQVDFLTIMEAKTLLYKIDSFRDYAMVLVMLYGGLRVSEVCNLDRKDVDLHSRSFFRNSFLFPPLVHADSETHHPNDGISIS